MADLISMLAAASGGQPTDPNFNQTVLLLHGDGTNGAQNNTFLDSSTNNFTITRNGNTTQGTFSPFSLAAGEWSNYFDGTGDYLTSPSSSAYLPSTTTTPFTLECWVYNTGTSATLLYSALALENYGFTLGFGSATGTYDSTATPWFGYFSGSWSGIRSTVSIPINAWTHIACVFTGSTCLIFQDGVQTASGGPSTWPSFAASVLRIGCRPDAINVFTGYISNARIVVGTAVYTAAFTPPTAPLTAISNTVLLTCQSNRFVDNSTNAFAVTRNGDVKVTPFSPFAPSAAYSASTNGGSGYFDGSGDELTVAGNSALDVTGDFTIEFWCYPLSTTTNYMCNGTQSGSGCWRFIIPSSGAVSWSLAVGSWAAVNITAPSGSTKIGAWNHIAATRSGDEHRLFVNGALVANTTVSGSLINTGRNTQIGYYVDGLGTYYSFMYASDFRIVKGTALYTAAFTPPTAPLTAITNTSLLCNFTNAGIFDNTGKNNLETVGNAQIDTTTKKFGTGSMEFDGTGDYLAAPRNVDFNFNTGDFTIECWFYIAANSSQNTDGNRRATLCSNLVNSSITGFEFLILGDSSTTGTGLRFTNAVSNTFYNISSATSVSQGTWHHFAAVRSGTTTTLYFNGTSVASGTLGNQNITSSNPLTIGGQNFTNYNHYLNGFIDDLRITKGVARYTANFTVPGKAFPDL